MTPIVLIPARLGATRLPYKPLKNLAGKPMILWVWEQALKANIGPVVVACDHPDIASVIHQRGGQAQLTDPGLPSGSDRVWAGLKTLDNHGTYDPILVVQGDVPLISPHHLHQALKPLHNPHVHIGTLAAEIEDEAEKTDPNVVKIALATEPTLFQRLSPSFSIEPKEADQIYRALYFSRQLIPSGPGPVYHHIGLYAYRRSILEQYVNLSPSPLEQREKLEQLRALEAGFRIDVCLIKEIPFGVDTLHDLEKAEKYLQKRSIL